LVGARRRVDAGLGGGNAVEGAVELAVAAAVEAVALVFLPELASKGATPAWRASCASVRKRSIGPISPSSD